MKAVILAGGFGKRLRPLTDQMPKPMIEVMGLPIIEWQVKWLSGFGIREFVICVGYMKEHIINHIGSGSRLGVRVGYAVEEEPLGTGGALKNAEGLLSGQSEFFMVNGDILTNLDPNRLRDGGGRNSLALVPLRSPFGVVEVNGDSRVLGFVEKPRIQDRWINAGVYHFTSDVFAYLPENGNIEVTALPALAKEGKLHAAKYDGIFWRSIDSHKDIEEATKEMQAANIK
ncbi:nucleotidyltransferase family protein [Nitrososphaera sp.]|uniref:nucleotidyltransferase family protein n=1 Tax=Nitrososphaera sp. TaxID=1971748 RepID=UPI00307D667E